jgi:hypothetical protein
MAWTTCSPKRVVGVHGHSIVTARALKNFPAVDAGAERDRLSARHLPARPRARRPSLRHTHRARLPEGGFGVFRVFRVPSRKLQLDTACSIGFQRFRGDFAHPNTPNRMISDRLDKKHLSVTRAALASLKVAAGSSQKSTVLLDLKRFV